MPNKEQYKKKKEYYKNYARQQRKANPQKAKRLLKEWLEKNREYFNEHARNYNHQNRMKLLKFLGNKCANHRKNFGCDFTDVRILQVDHINGGGQKDFQRFSGSQLMAGYYSRHLDEAKLKLQLLCPNCNWLKRVENKEANQFR